MNRSIRLSIMAASLLSSVCACRSKPEASSKTATSPSPLDSNSLHFADSEVAFDYPSDFKVSGRINKGDDYIGIDPKVPPRGSGDGAGSLQPDPVHPDMLLQDEADSFAKATVEQKGKVIGGVRSIAVKNGSCRAMVVIAPWDPCPDNAPFKPASGTCYEGMLYAFCATPAGKRMIYSSVLGALPTADALTPEAAAIGKTHERILSTLEFK